MYVPLGEAELSQNAAMYAVTTYTRVAIYYIAKAPALSSSDLSIVISHSTQSSPVKTVVNRTPASSDVQEPQKLVPGPDGSPDASPGYPRRFQVPTDRDIRSISLNDERCRSVGSSSRYHHDGPDNDESSSSLIMNRTDGTRIRAVK